MDRNTLLLLAGVGAALWWLSRPTTPAVTAPVALVAQPGTPSQTPASVSLSGQYYDHECDEYRPFRAVTGRLFRRL